MAAMYSRNAQALHTAVCGRAVDRILAHPGVEPAGLKLACKAHTHANQLLKRDGFEHAPSSLRPPPSASDKAQGSNRVRERVGIRYTHCASTSMPTMHLASERAA